MRLRVLLFLGLAAAVATGQETPDFLHETEPRTQLMFLGVFHFRDAGLDDHKPEHQFDILSDRRQEELEVVLDRLVEFAPTRIAVERRATKQENLDADYRSYLDGDLELTSHETHQIAFRLAKRLRHDRLWAIDARGIDVIEDWDHWSKRIQDFGQEDLESEWTEEYKAFALYEDRMTDEQPLLDTLIYMNSEDRVRQSHGQYLVGNAKAGRGEEYLGPDSRTRWYNRNLRIFSNIQRIDVSADDRILVLIGAGHLPILHFCARSSPEYQFVSAGAVLAGPRPAEAGR